MGEMEVIENKNNFQNYLCYIQCGSENWMCPYFEESNQVLALHGLISNALIGKNNLKPEQQKAWILE